MYVYLTQYECPGCVLCACRVWDPTKRSTTAHTELTPSLLSLDWVPQSENLVSSLHVNHNCCMSCVALSMVQILVGTGGGVVKLFDSASSSYIWEVAKEITFPRCVYVYLSYD